MLGNLRRSQNSNQNRFPVLPELRIPTTPRNAITPRPNKPRLSRKDEARINTLSYAQAIALAAMPPENIRNVSIVGETAEATKIANALRKDNLFSDMPINAVNSKGPTNLTFKCNDKESAKAHHISHFKQNLLNQCTLKFIHATRDIEKDEEIILA